MRGVVYRPVRRRAGSILLALGVAGALVGGAAATATAKPASRSARPVSTLAWPVSTSASPVSRSAGPAGDARATVKSPYVIAHATGHKIA
jgi:hypothetical protein